MDRHWASIGALICFLGVVLGAFGAHGLRQRLSTEMLTIFEVGVRYQMFHGLALFAVAWATTRWPQSNASMAGWFFVAGVAIFSGSLYMLAITGQKWLGAITPVGGVALLVGWIILFFSARA